MLEQRTRYSTAVSCNGPLSAVKFLMLKQISCTVNWLRCIFYIHLKINKRTGKYEGINVLCLLRTWIITTLKQQEHTCNIPLSQTNYLEEWWNVWLLCSGNCQRFLQHWIRIHKSTSEAAQFVTSHSELWGLGI